jgi:2-iminobutanoate/2-iminopropanoate deaminase
MSKQVIATPLAPAAIGPYSQGVRTGNLIFTAGQIALDPLTQQVVAGGVAEQTTRVLENLKAILEAAGSRMENVVKSTVFLKDFNDFSAMNAIYGAYLDREGVPPPARSTVEVARLPKDVLVEIELVAEI